MLENPYVLDLLPQLYRQAHRELAERRLLVRRAEEAFQVQAPENVPLSSILMLLQRIRPPFTGRL